MDTARYIEVNPQVSLGRPVFKGTRLAVEHVLREKAAGATDADLLDAFPQLTADHLHAAWLYAADLIALETTATL